ncbi:DnaB-like helicase C-terminal domain-containing protein [Vulgatibacter sp.]|uniref:DnaB-like helicase C-terminal domain-containing protein n=1 Tax=Vulgatibacter sp. TaxID=1971226 RepID=UPI003565DF4C
METLAENPVLDPNIAIERKLLGAILIDPAVIRLPGVADLSVDDFEAQESRIIFRDMQQHPEGIATDLIKLRLNKAGLLTSKVIDALTDAEERSLTKANAGVDAAIIKARAAERKEEATRQAVAREVLAVARGIASGEVPASEARRIVVERLDRVAERAAPRSRRFVTGPGAFAAPFERLLRRLTQREKPIPTSLPTLNKIMGGGLGRGVHVIVGNTGTGKSQLALELALTAAEQGYPSLYLGLELDDLDVTARIMGLRSGRDKRWADFFLGNADQQDYAAAVGALNNVSNLPFAYHTPTALAWSHTELRSTAAELRDLHPEEEPGALPMLIVLDFLQIVDGTERELRERIKAASYSARAVAIAYNTAIVLVSSTGREHYATLSGETKKTSGGGNIEAFGEGDPSRFVGMGKESGEIEFSADSLLVLGRTPSKDLRMGVAKLRARPTEHADFNGWIDLAFDGNRHREPAAPRKVEGFGR